MTPETASLLLGLLSQVNFSMSDPDVEAQVRAAATARSELLAVLAEAKASPDN